MYETGVEAKARLIKEAAARGDFGLKLCERHYFAHVEGGPACIFRTSQDLGDVLEELEQEFDHLDNLLDQLEIVIAPTNEEVKE